MEHTLYAPLEYYENYAKEAHDKNTKELFESLRATSGVNIDENRQTVKKYKDLLKKIEKLKTKLWWLKFLRICLVVLIFVGALGACLCVGSDSAPLGAKIGVSIGAIALAVGIILLIFLKLNKVIRQFADKLSEKQRQADELLALAWRQMEPLNRLFEDDMTFSLIEKTIPDMTFDKQFTPGRLSELEKNYAYESSADPTTSITDTVSGAYEGNPFLFERSLSQGMGTRAYHGQLLIRWTTYVRDKNGTRAVTRTQMLHATVVKPIPVYSTDTHLNFGCQAAPDLSFSRKAQGTEQLSEKEVERKVKRGERKLKRKAEKSLADGGHFTEMTNSEFDVLFGATDRNHEQQFRLMFTPLAQVETVRLLRSRAGFGDDFDFIKRGRHNIVRSRHAAAWSMGTEASRFYSYDYDACYENFVSFNNDYFKSVYFDFAPLFAIPAYHSEPVKSMEAISAAYHFTSKEYETMANRIGAQSFAHEASRTNIILKASPISRGDIFDRVSVTAYSFTTAERVDFVPTLGGDGRIHPVPVYWTEYIPVSRTSFMDVASLDISETEFKRNKSAFGSAIPTLSACYHGLFAHVCQGGAPAEIGNMIRRINEILGNGANKNVKPSPPKIKSEKTDNATFSKKADEAFEKIEETKEIKEKTPEESSEQITENKEI